MNWNGCCCCGFDAVVFYVVFSRQIRSLKQNKTDGGWSLPVAHVGCVVARNQSRMDGWACSKTIHGAPKVYFHYLELARAWMGC